MRLEPLEPRVMLSGLTWLLQGDLDHDGYVGLPDAVLMSRMAVRLDPVNLLGDLSGDGRVTGCDASLAWGLELFGSFWLNGNKLDSTIYDGRTVMSDGLLNVFTVTPTDTGSWWTVPETTAALWGTGPQLADIQQGSQIADCYLLAAIGALTITHPDDLERRITLDGTGFAVELQASDGHAVIVHVDRRFSVAAQVDNDQGIWWGVVRKAYAFFRGWDANRQPLNTLESIGWGYPTVPYMQFGWPATTVYVGTLNANQWAATVAQDLATGYAVMFQTSPSATAFPPSHVVLVLSVDVQANTAVTWHPWGITQTVAISTILADDINQLAVGR